MKGTIIGAALSTTIFGLWVIGCLGILLYDICTDVEDLQAIVKEQSKQIEALKQDRQIKPIEVTVTAYSPREVETDSTPFITAFNREVRHGIIAVSRDLFMDGWIPGRKVYIYQIGVFEVGDLMHHRKTNQLDIFFHSTEQALEFGIRRTKAILLEI